MRTNFFAQFLKKVCVVSFLTIVLVIPTPKAKAEPMKEFIMACTYGVLAGTLVGAATLAFTKKPGDNLRNIARGASLGLYSGIALGLYVIYVVPAQEIENYEKAIQEPSQGGVYYPQEPRFIIAPSFGETGIEGANIQFTALSW